jgi:hypothetical protein
MKLGTLFSLVAVTATLAACGGGGGGDAAPVTGTPSAGAAAPATGVVPAAGTTAPIAATATGASAYTGSWITTCLLSDELKIGTAPAYILASWRNLTASSASAFVGQGQEQIFDNNQCSGTAKATHNWAISFLIAGTADAKGKLADKVTITEGAIGGGLSSGGTININGVIYPGNYFTRTFIDKDLFRLEGNKLFFGTGPLDAAGFPTEINATSFFTKL